MDLITCMSSNKSSLALPNRCIIVRTGSKKVTVRKLIHVIFLQVLEASISSHEVVGNKI